LSHGWKRRIARRTAFASFWGDRPCRKGAAWRGPAAREPAEAEALPREKQRRRTTRSLEGAETGEKDNDKGGLSMGWKLVAFDMDGTLTTGRTLWEVMHRKWGTWESHGLPYWERYRAGGWPYDEFAAMDVKSWAGAPEAMLFEAADEVELMPGCEELLTGLRAAGAATAIISNGLACLGERLAARFGMARVLANRHHARQGRLTGGIDILVPYEKKGEALRKLMAELGARPEETAAVGDSRSDAAMFAVAGLGVAFRPSDHHVLNGAHHVVEAGDLRDVARLLGVA